MTGPGACGEEGRRRHPDPYHSVRVYLTPEERVPVGALLSVRYRLRRTRDGEEGPDAEDLADVQALDGELRRRYEQQNGPILAEYYCTEAVGACVLAGSPDGPSRRLAYELHHPGEELRGMLRHIQEVEREARMVLDSHGHGSAPAQLTWAVEAAYDAMIEVLGCADDLADTEGAEADRTHLLEATQRGVDELTREIHGAVQRQARFTYFVGILAGAVGTLLLAVGLGILATAQGWDVGVQVTSLTGAAIGGTVGAVVSVSQRLATGKLAPECTLPLHQRYLLGGLRPLTGAVFGGIAQLALAAGLIGSTGTPAPHSVGFSVVVGFAAGFSERFALDVIERTEGGLAPDAEAGHPRHGYPKGGEVDGGTAPARSADVGQHARGPAGQRVAEITAVPSGRATSDTG